jgi:predicted phosphodiesterase
VELLVAQNVDMLLHLGDVGSVEVIDALLTPGPSGGQIEAHVVFGNTDWDAVNLGRYAQSLGIQVDDPMGVLAVDGGDLAFTHGHDADRMAQALARGVRYLCHGHTHRPTDQTTGNTRIINPGALFRAKRYTVAVLSTAQDELAFYPVPER